MQRQLRRQWRQLLSKLDVRPPLDVAELCRQVGELRGKPIRLVAHPISANGPFGAWITTAAADYLLYQENTSKSHQDHIILHELGHLLGGHQSADSGEDVPNSDPDLDLLQERYPDIGPGSVQRALRRTSYDTAEEIEAESAATIILEWASVLDVVAYQPSPNPTTERIGSALNDRLGWL
ncbi:hypothetical protein ACFQ68_08750 [Amycolatopsis japonica]|uniref:hypothetical protein n=1 Tax=Amycolatopsis japonica TaxID=208439 RepID=UPI0036727203